MGLINFNNEQKLVQNEIRKFANQEIEPVVQDIEKDAKIPREILKKLAELGFLCPVLPVDLGGAGMDTTSLCIIIEELSKVCASLGLVLAVNNGLVSFALVKYGRERQKLYLDRIGKGEIGGFDNGVGPVEIIHQKPLKIKGTRRLLLNGEMADFLLLQVNSDNVKGLFIVNKSDVQTKRPYLLGMQSAGIVDVSFEGIELSEDLCLIDGINFDKSLSEIKRYFSLCLSAVALGISQAGLEASIKYSKERRQFNRPICEFPMVREMLAEMKIKIEATRNLVYEVANRVDVDESYALDADIAFAISSETAVYCGIKSVQIFGGYGYTKDYLVERYLRDAKSVELLGGSPLTLKENIAQMLLE